MGSLKYLIIILNILTSCGFLISSIKRSDFSTMFSSSKSTDTIKEPKFAPSVVKSFINFPPVSNVLLSISKSAMINSAEKGGIPWTLMMNTLKRKEKILKSYFAEIEDKSIEYPEYYIQNFHGYKGGNLNWMAAHECESAAKFVAAGTYAGEKLDVDVAFDKMRTSFTDSIKSYVSKYRSNTFNSIADIGCSIGMTTFYLGKAFPNLEKLDAYDLSPYFLAVAKYRQNVILNEDFVEMTERQSVWSHLSNIPASSVSMIRWLHAKAENMKDTPSDSYDLTVISAVLHELPQVNSKIGG